MRLLFVTGLTGYGIGGARTEEVRLVGGMACRGMDVAMTSDVLPDDLAGIRHFHIDYPPGASAGAQIASAVAQFKPDLIQATGGGMRFLNACDRQLRDRPWVCTIHNAPPAERILQRFHGNERLHYAVRDAIALPSTLAWMRFFRRASCQRFIAHSRTVARRILSSGCAPEKVVEIPFGSELPASATTRDPNEPSPFPADAFPRVLTVAGLAHHKGQLDAVRLAARLLPEFPKLSLRLIGMSRDKPYRAYLEKTIRDLGLSEHVSILHRVSESVKFAALHDTDLYLQPSHEEGFCIAFLEAAMLVPRLIGADTGAIAAMSEGDPSARVVRPGDVEAMARAARELLQMANPNGAVEHRRESLSRRYSWEGYLNQHLEMYRSVLGSG